MPRFSANLGFLWKELALPDAVRAAKRAGFHAVECHWPYDVPIADLKAALDETGLKMLGINTRRGNVDAGENGLSALSDREVEARAAIDDAIAYAATIGCRNIHVMAGFAAGEAPHNTFIKNLAYACDAAKGEDINILIEPLNHYDAPGYFLSNTTQAAQIIGDVGAPNLKLMFDCYHVQLMEGDVSNRLKKLMPIIGHIQFASVPGRSEPGQGELNYPYVFKLLDELGYDRPLGAEYKPNGETEKTLTWLRAFS